MLPWLSGRILRRNLSASLVRWSSDNDVTCVAPGPCCLQPQAWPRNPAPARQQPHVVPMRPIVVNGAMPAPAFAYKASA